MGKRFIIQTSAVLLLSAVLLWSSWGGAMPGFARKYRMSCQTCHAPFPKLKPYGDEFAANGFHLPEGDPRRTRLNTGDDLLTLVKDFPIGMRIDLFATYEHHGDWSYVSPADGSSDRSPHDDANVDLKTPFNLKIISGGPIGEKVSYYFYFFLSEGGEIAGIEDAFVVFSDLFGSGLNLTVGQFAVSDPIFKGELRLTREAYRLYEQTPGNSSVDLKYDRGIVLDCGFDFGLDLVLEVINGNGIGFASEATGAFDSDNYKDVIFRASQGMGPVRVGGFVYYGKEKQPVDQADDGSKATNTALYIGGDTTLELGPVELNGMYLIRTDDNPDFLASGARDVTSQGVMLEAILLPGYDRGRWALTGLYNLFFSDYESEGMNTLDYHAATLSFTWLAHRNARLMAEYTYVVKQHIEGVLYENGHRALLGFVGAF